MLIECALAIVSLCAVGYIWSRYTDGTTVVPTAVFATGISEMVATIPGLGGSTHVLYSLLVLTVSVFCLTSLDTATRLARYMFQEFWLEPGQTYKEATGYKAVLTNPVVSTVITVVLGIGLGLTGYSKIWPCSVHPTSCWQPSDFLLLLPGLEKSAKTTKCSCSRWYSC